MGIETTQQLYKRFNTMQTIYNEHGFNSRKEYLIDLADQYNVDQSAVFEMAQLLGSSEDFDGLVSMLEDLAY